MQYDLGLLGLIIRVVIRDIIRATRIVRFIRDIWVTGILEY